MREANYRGGASRTQLVEASRQLRREQTDAEARLWHHLRGSQLGGAKFRRQHEFGPCILDFYCAEHRLVIEADGGHHFDAEQAARDAARTAYLSAHGLRVLRFTNLEISQQTDTVLEIILRALETPSPQPSPTGRGSTPRASCYGRER